MYGIISKAVRLLTNEPKTLGTFRQSLLHLGTQKHGFKTGYRGVVKHFVLIRTKNVAFNEVL